MPVELADGAVSVGNAADCRIVIKGDGVAAHHCEIVLQTGRASVRPLDANAPTVLNGRQVSAETPIKDGDLLVLGRVGVSIVGERKAAAAPAKAESAQDDRTRVRAALPRFLLRGVSGATLGKTYAVTDNAVIGRQPDCDLPIPAEEVSRHHARDRERFFQLDVVDEGEAAAACLRCRFGFDRLQLAVGEFVECLGRVVLEQALDQLALLAHLAHAVEILGLHRVAAGTLGEVEQGIVDILEQGSDQRVDALERNAPHEFQQVAESVGGSRPGLALLQVDDVRIVFGSGHCGFP